MEDEIRPILETFEFEQARAVTMTDKAPRNNAHCTIPDDPEQSTYRFIIVAAKRARQLQGGARPVLPTSSKKPTVIAMEEVRRGLVKYDLHRPKRRRKRAGRPKPRSKAPVHEGPTRRRRRHRGLQGRRAGARC